MDFIKPEPKQYPLPLNQLAAGFVDTINELMLKDGSNLSGIIVIGIREKKYDEEQLEGGWGAMVSNLPQNQAVYFVRNFIEDFEEKLERGNQIENMFN